MPLTLQQLDGLLNSTAARARCRAALVLAAKEKAALPLPQNPIQSDIDNYNFRKMLAHRIQLPGGADEYVGKMANAAMAYMAASPHVALVGTDDATLSEGEKTNVDALMRAAFLAIFDTFLGT